MAKVLVMVMAMVTVGIVILNAPSKGFLGDLTLLEPHRAHTVPVPSLLHQEMLQVQHNQSRPSDGDGDGDGDGD